jgi:multicomponent Na+:H+ antiporter subunit G
MILDAVAIAFLAGGAFFLLVSTVGLLRLPDFFSRTHAVGKSETLGGLLVLVGLAIHSGFQLESLKLLLILLFIAVTNPAGVHTVARAALRAGLEPWTGETDGPAEGDGDMPAPTIPRREGGT